MSIGVPIDPLSVIPLIAETVLVELVQVTPLATYDGPVLNVVLKLVEFLVVPVGDDPTYSYSINDGNGVGVGVGVLVAVGLGLGVGVGVELAVGVGVAVGGIGVGVGVGRYVKVSSTFHFNTSPPVKPVYTLYGNDSKLTGSNVAILTFVVAE
jgi:hypothetical protein